jgi:hypothetical protein
MRMKAAKGLIVGLALATRGTLPAASETVQLQQLHGLYMVPVRINDAVAIPFILDSGASEVAIPQDVFLVLLRSGTVNDSDFIGTGTYIMADGSKQSSRRFVLHEMAVGSQILTNVVANVISVKGDPLLGQSFLSKLPAWTIDNARQALVFNGGPAGEPQQATVPIEERSLQVVRAFYTALERADGANASRLVIPEKRSRGPLSASEITGFYSSLAKPLRLLNIRPSSIDAVEVLYQYSSPGGRPCRGSAVVSLAYRGDELLIDAIKAIENC